MIRNGIFGGRMNVLVIAPRFPWPLEKGDKLRLYQQLRLLSRHHTLHLFAITHVPVSEHDLSHLRSICSSIHLHHIPFWRAGWNMLKGLFSSVPFSVLYFSDQAAIGSLNRLHSEIQPDLIYGQLIRSGEYLKRLAGMKVIDMMDAFSLIMKQRAEHASWWSRPFLQWEARRLQNYERDMPLHTSRQTFISHRDRHEVDPDERWPATIIPNGIDTTYFQSGSVSLDQEAYDLTFIGNLGYYPNYKAVLFLVHRIMPLVWSHRPATTLLLAGARPVREIQKIADRRVRVIPWLDDIRQGYRKGSIFVAPIHLGAGQQNKILEAMAMELPVITTTHVNRGIQAKPNIDLLIADQPEEFAAHITRLLDAPADIDNMTRSARTFVETNYSWSTSVETLENNVFLHDPSDHH